MHRDEYGTWFARTSVIFPEVVKVFDRGSASDRRVLTQTWQAALACCPAELADDAIAKMVAGELERPAYGWSELPALVNRYANGRRNALSQASREIREQQERAKARETRELRSAVRQALVPTCEPATGERKFTDGKIPDTPEGDAEVSRRIHELVDRLNGRAALKRVAEPTEQELVQERRIAAAAAEDAAKWAATKTHRESMLGPASDADVERAASNEARGAVLAGIEKAAGKRKTAREKRGEQWK